MARITASAPGASAPSLLERALVLRGAPRELWVIYLVKVLEIAAYGLMTGTVVLWLSADLGFSDAAAGDVYTWWSSITTVAVLLVGALTDNIGIKRSFLLGFWICVVTRTVLVASAEPWVAIPFGLLPSAIGIALMSPVMITAVKAYTNAAQRALGFSIFYTLINVGYALAGWTFDAVRGSMGEYGTTQVLGLELTAYRVILLVALALTVPGLLITRFFLRDGVTVTESGVRIDPPRQRTGTALGAVRQAAVGTVRTFAEVWREKTFYKFLGFLALLVGARLVFYHMQVTFPKFAIRELGEGAPIGQLWGMLNPLLIVVLVPLVGALCGRISSYVMVLVGSAITAASVLILVVDPAVFQPLADGWLGDLVARRWLGVEGAVNPWYVSIALFAVLLSVGEALWSPRLYEYTAAVAPQGKVGSYMALSLLPYFLAQFGVGMLSGRLLAAYVPAEGARDPSTLWLLVAAMAAVCPVGLLVFRRWLRVPEDGR